MLRFQDRKGIRSVAALIILAAAMEFRLGLSAYIAEFGWMAGEEVFSQLVMDFQPLPYIPLVSATGRPVFIDVPGMSKEFHG